MHVPLPFFPVHPGKRATELGDEVVALRLVAVPPAARDALGPGHQREPAFLHRNDTAQQPGRPRSRLHELVWIPFARRDALPGMLGAVVRVRRDAIHGLASEPRLQALDEARPVLAFGGAVAE